MNSEFTYEIVPNPEEGYARINAQGSIDIGSLKQLYANALNDPLYKKGMNRLWDLAHLDVSRLTSKDIETFAGYMKRESIGIDSVYSAIFATEDLTIGMVNVLKGIGQGVITQNVLVTRSLKEAVDWVTKRSQNNS